MQTLQIGKDTILVDKMFSGSAQNAKYQLVEGRVIEIEAPKPAPPEVAYLEDGHRFFYKGPGLKLVDREDHIWHVPEPWHSLALQQIERLKAGQPVVPVRPVEPERAKRVASRKNEQIARRAGRQPVRIAKDSAAGAVIDEVLDRSIDQIEEAFGPRVRR